MENGNAMDGTNAPVKPYPSKAPRASLTDEQARAIRLYEKRGTALRLAGHGGIVDAARMQERIRTLIDTHHVQIRTLARKTGVSIQCLAWHYRGADGTGPLTTCRWATEQAVMGTKFGPGDVARVPAVGTQRRMHALLSVGYGYKHMAALLGVEHTHLHRIATINKETTATTARNVRALYEKYGLTDPLEAGGTQHSVRYAQGCALKHGYAPPLAWDDDTIDDPDGYPDWTGECGTVTGYYLHLKYALKLRTWYQGNGKERRVVECEPCTQARRDRKHDINENYLKLNPTEIRKEYDGGLPAKALAELHGVSVKTVYRALKGHR